MNTEGAEAGQLSRDEQLPPQRLDEIAAEIRSFCEANGDPRQVQKYARYFTEGYDAYGIPKEVWEQQNLSFYRKYREELGLQGFLELGDRLFRSGKYEEGSLALCSVAPFLNEFEPASVRHVGDWLENGVRNWAHTDCLCSMLLGPVLKAGVISIHDLGDWRNSEVKWKRRAVPVTLLAILGGRIDVAIVLDFLRPMMLDPERVVHQGLGWFLREAWKRNPEPVEAFLLEWKDTASRLIFQYATEKMPPEEKARFRKSKRG